MIPSPPESTMRPETCARQRAELVGIAANEAHRAPRRRLVPLAAAAAVLAVVASLAVGIPMMRRDESTAQAGSASRQTVVEPLSDAERTMVAKACFDSKGIPPGRQQHEQYAVLDGFRFANAPDAFSATWVVIRTSPGLSIACGLNGEGVVVQRLLYGKNQDMYRAVETRMIGAGAYAPHISRITVAVGNHPPVEAVLRHGFYFTAVPYVRVRGPHTDATPLPYTVRGYDSAGNLAYSSPANDGEWRADGNACYINPNGKLIAWMSDDPHPDPKTCRRSFIWNYQ